MKTRRGFLKIAGTGIIAAGMSPMYSNSLSDNTASEDTFSLGMAGYTFREFSADQAIEMMKRLNVSYVSVKDFHLPYNSSPQVIRDIISKFQQAAIRVYTLGVIYMKTKEFVDQAFEYAKATGVKMIVGAPDYALLPYVEEKVISNDIRLAIHNHGPDNPLYPNAADVWSHIDGHDSRLGICIDIGHTIRDGKDPAYDIEKYHSRIFDVHIKDVDRADKDGKTVEMGRGIIDIPAVIASLRKINYSGVCSLEFEKDMKDPLPGIAESIGYWKGVIKCGRK
jgi:sugar phosphate isomerase/epimerase